MTKTGFLPYLPGLLFGVFLLAFLLVTSYIFPPTGKRLALFRTARVAVSLLLASVLSALTWSALRWSSSVQRQAVEAMTLESGLSWRFLVGALVGLAGATAVVLKSWNWGRHAYRCDR